MKRCFEIGRYVVALAAFACLTGSQPAAAQTLAVEPLKDSGSNIYPAFEGWYQNSDGTYTLLIGYYRDSRRTSRSAAVGGRSRSRCRRISATRN